VHGGDEGVRTVRRQSTKRTVVVELTDVEREVLADRERRLQALERAITALAADPLQGLQRVARVLPLAAAVEMLTIRLLAEGSQNLYLVARDGLPSSNIRELALDRITVAKQRSIFSLGGHHSEARALGLRYVSGEWLRNGSTTVGSITIGCRTDRRPSAAERELVAEAAPRIAECLGDIDRSEDNLRKLSLAMARAATLAHPDIPEALLAALRPREATVLELYAEGRSVDEIASMLVISPHTVRTHIKLAFRRLGIHSRDEAAKLVRADQVTALL
jgi:DNA-binding CsgD family transcriptional regulator